MDLSASPVMFVLFEIYLLRSVGNSFPKITILCQWENNEQLMLAGMSSSRENIKGKYCKRDATIQAVRTF